MMIIDKCAQVESTHLIRVIGPPMINVMAEGGHEEADRLQLAQQPDQIELPYAQIDEMGHCVRMRPVVVRWIAIASPNHQDESAQNVAGRVQSLAQLQLVAHRQDRLFSGEILRQEKLMIIVIIDRQKIVRPFPPTINSWQQNLRPPPLAPC